MAAESQEAAAQAAGPTDHVNWNTPRSCSRPEEDASDAIVPKKTEGKKAAETSISSSAKNVQFRLGAHLQGMWPHHRPDRQRSLAHAARPSHPRPAPASPVLGV